ncbi:LysR family transcriptional regulator [Xenorhabdus nematophila]|uniref:Transcriptional regulator n=1 Tax=Xenorhabdus nematophila (strain ATCC 19061 / DSM 3370 / CCUG 14189 / LMG 1036 / NCIMB 9965 / AN6) TaxID=406817 RepID=D3VK39_XENNA|nr:LysR family transcriptional regulator [Xenorhabdus nematophila]CEE90420.1 putative transcriptional regulator [Xenorhabdus nematophila str. Anatoliense]CBJ91098.1 putative transcriptional regulator [Xenorhabdus nematophila ATCC 19061]CCW29211.1 putative transcriptional regulator [Xenorhabdus nematophila F1]CEE92415.1 putative transcriptional regulator [Xenorhabdus nematophila str. Anatoliense]CEK23920.1 putative transcriptional regulator [Xenorhabdus nematophila AN6/1]
MDRVTAAQVFVTIVEQGSLIAAAERLDMSRAMVSRYLAEMEQWAGIRLLHRTTRKISLTSAGESAYQRSLKLMELAEEIPVQQFSEAQTLRGLLRVSCSQSLGISALSAAIPEFTRIYPQIAVNLQINNKAINLIEERIDLAIRITNNLEPNLIARPLSTCYSVVCAAPSYLAGKSIPQNPADLASHNCLTYNFFGKSLWLFEKQHEQYSVPVSGTLSANESTVLMEAALLGAGIAMQPYYSVSPYLISGQLVELLPDYQPQAMGIYAIYSSRQNMPVILRALLDFLVDWFATSSHWQELQLMEKSECQFFGK